MLESLRNSDVLGLLDGLQTFCALLDARGRVMGMNAAFEDFLGLSRRTAKGQQFSQWLDAEARPLFASTLEQKILDGHKLRLHAAPFLLLIQNVASEARLTESHTQGFLLVEAFPLVWVSQHLEQERVQFQADQEKDLMRNLAHEIKNPLGGIRGAAQLLQSSVAQLGADKQTLHLAHIVMKEADRLKSLLDRFLMPHRQALQRERISIYEVLERVRSVLLAEYPQGLEIVRDYDVSLPELDAERESLIQAVLNLGRNALQAMSCVLQEYRARLIFKTRAVRRLTLQGQVYPLGLELCILDNGAGIEPALQKRIFQPLVSGRSDGTGLGLTLSQNIIQAHCGLLFLRSSQPGATEFCIQLPLGASGASPSTSSTV